MWQTLLDTLRRVVTLADELTDTKEEIKDIRQELRDLARVVYELRAEIRADKEHDQIRRENLVLRLKSEIDRIERRLPSSKE